MFHPKSSLHIYIAASHPLIHICNTYVFNHSFVIIVFVIVTITYVHNIMEIFRYLRWNLDYPNQSRVPSMNTHDQT